MPLKFTAYDQSAEIKGTGTVTDISSKGIAFHADIPLRPGMKLTASLSWPALLGDCMLKLVVEGRILRVESQLHVMNIGHHEFRTSGRTGTAHREEIAQQMRLLGDMMLQPTA